MQNSVIGIAEKPLVGIIDDIAINDRDTELRTLLLAADKTGFPYVWTFVIAMDFPLPTAFLVLLSHASGR